MVYVRCEEKGLPESPAERDVPFDREEALGGSLDFVFVMEVKEVKMTAEES
jgi:hypothetical protein